MGNETINGGTDLLTVNKSALDIQENSKFNYINDSIDMLCNFKKSQEIILGSEGKNVPLMIKVAQKNLTKISLKQCNSMILELQKDFNDVGVRTFIQKTISIVTSAETSNLLYGDIIDVKEVRRALSKKTTDILNIRVDKLISQLNKTNFEEKVKLNVILDNFNLCNKVLEYCWDIDPKNLDCLDQTIKILNTLITQRVKLGFDNYYIEVLKIMKENTKNKIEDIENNDFQLDSNGQIINESSNLNSEIKSSLDESLVIKNDSKTTDLILINSSDNSSKNREKLIEAATARFIDVTNEIIEDLKEGYNNDFIGMAFQKFYSIITAIETLNYMKGIIIDEDAVLKNISELLTDLICENYANITESWNEIEFKTDDDYRNHLKELKNYRKLLFEAYEIDERNKLALKKAVDLDIEMLKFKKDFKLSLHDRELLESNINKHIAEIKEAFPDFKGLEKDVEPKTKKAKKKSFWAKIFK